MNETRPTNERVSRLRRIAAFVAILIGVGALLATGIMLLCEKKWVKPQHLSPESAFSNGTIGTEVMPLAVLRVLPELTRERGHFAPIAGSKGDWIDQFGFLHSKENKELPTGFTLSNYRPRSGAPSPIPFVGIGCATCHTSDLVRPDGSTYRVVGTGNSSINLFGWLDALQAAILDRDKVSGQYIVTPESVADANQRLGYDKPSIKEQLMICLWLDGFRETLAGNLPRFDEPFGNGKSFEPEITPTGPGRTQPFRTLVRNVLMRPGNNMYVFTKIAPVYHEDWQEWAQVDGGIKGLDYRSALAVLAAGATVQNMRVPEIERNIRSATDFVRKLSGPSYREVFPKEVLNEQRVKQGHDVYMTYCYSCHGAPGPNGNWNNGPRQGEVVPVEEIGTDPERVTFRHGEELPEKLFQHFPDGHPFKFPRDDIRALRGYLNEPLDSAFTRAPYLHNASVLTMAQLINLDERQKVVYRGRNVYDPAKLGLVSPHEPNTDVYFRFDTTQRGNSNAGHDYPWKYHGPGWDESKLKDLLEYLKTI